MKTQAAAIALGTLLVLGLTAPSMARNHHRAMSYPAHAGRVATPASGYPDNSGYYDSTAPYDGSGADISGSIGGIGR